MCFFYERGLNCRNNQVDTLMDYQEKDKKKNRQSHHPMKIKRLGTSLHQDLYF